MSFQIAGTGQTIHEQDTEEYRALVNDTLQAILDRERVDIENFTIPGETCRCCFFSSPDLQNQAELATLIKDLNNLNHHDLQAADTASIRVQLLSFALFLEEGGNPQLKKACYLLSGCGFNASLIPNESIKTLASQHKTDIAFRAQQYRPDHLPQATYEEKLITLFNLPQDSTPSSPLRKAATRSGSGHYSKSSGRK